MGAGSDLLHGSAMDLSVKKSATSLTRPSELENDLMGMADDELRKGRSRVRRSAGVEAAQNVIEPANNEEDLFVDGAVFDFGDDDGADGP